MLFRYLSRLTRASFVFVPIFVANVASATVSLSLDPSASYLLNTADSQGNAAKNAVGFSLADFGFSAGEAIFLYRFGDYKAGSGINPTSGLPFLDNRTTLFGVFSSSNTLLDRLQLNRLPGALASNGLPANSKPTSFGNPIGGPKLATDIPEDFDVNNGGVGTAVTIPVGANYIFFTVDDTNFADNSDPNGNFGVNISAVSEPSSFAIMLLGLSAMGFAMRSRKTR